MNRYTVVLSPGVEDELAEIWMNAADRAEVARASRELELQLSVDADQKGRPVSDRAREISEPPLHLMFRVSEDDRIVEVFSITRIDD